MDPSHVFSFWCYCCDGAREGEFAVNDESDCVSVRCYHCGTEEEFPYYLDNPDRVEGMIEEFGHQVPSA